MIIGVTGTLGAGKTTVVDYLTKQLGFVHFSVRSYLTEILESRNVEVNRDTLVALGNELRAEHTPSYIVEELYKKAQKAGKDACIESIRAVGEVEELRKYPDFVLVAVDADVKTRYERIVVRKAVTDKISFERFLEQEEREMHSDDPNKQNLTACIARADVVILNNGSQEEFFEQVRVKLDRFQKGY